MLEKKSRFTGLGRGVGVATLGVGFAIPEMSVVAERVETTSPVSVTRTLFDFGASAASSSGETSFATGSRRFSRLRH